MSPLWRWCELPGFLGGISERDNKTGLRKGTVWLLGDEMIQATLLPMWMTVMFQNSSVVRCYLWVCRKVYTSFHCFVFHKGSDLLGNSPKLRRTSVKWHIYPCVYSFQPNIGFYLIAICLHTFGLEQSSCVAVSKGRTPEHLTEMAAILQSNSLLSWRNVL